jgi:hypothetical protein
VALDTRTRTITISLIIAVVLIVGAFYYSGHSLSLHPASANAESSEELLKAYAEKDTDSDGLPDWQEALYGTSPTNAHSVRPTLTDSQAVAQGLVTPQYADAASANAPTPSKKATTVPGPAAAPGSLTEQFAQLFFNNYLGNRGSTPPSADEMQTFVQSAIAELETSQVKTDAYAATDMKVAGNGGDALRAYAGAMDDAFAAHTVQLPYDELTYFSDAVEKNDATALKNVGLIGAAYVNVSRDAAKASVPDEAAAAHLALVNAMARLGNTINDMATVDDDPIRAMLGLQSYPGDLATFVSALGAMNQVFTGESVTIARDAKGGSFFHLMTVASAQTAPAP